jgi:hypothetical protein
VSVSILQTLIKNKKLLEKLLVKYLKFKLSLLLIKQFHFILTIIFSSTFLLMINAGVQGVCAPLVKIEHDWKYVYDDFDDYDDYDGGKQQGATICRCCQESESNTRYKTKIFDQCFQATNPRWLPLSNEFMFDSLSATNNKEKEKAGQLICKECCQKEGRLCNSWITVYINDGLSSTSYNSDYYANKKWKTCDKCEKSFHNKDTSTLQLLTIDCSSFKFHYVTAIPRDVETGARAVNPNIVTADANIVKVTTSITADAVSDWESKGNLQPLLRQFLMDSEQSFPREMIALISDYTSFHDTIDNRNYWSDDKKKEKQEVQQRKKDEKKQGGRRNQSFISVHVMCIYNPNDVDESKRKIDNFENNFTIVLQTRGLFTSSHSYKSVSLLTIDRLFHPDQISWYDCNGKPIIDDDDNF